MTKLNRILMVVLCLCLWGVSVKSSLSTMKYKIVFSEPTVNVLYEKNRIVELYRELSYGVEEDSMYEVILLCEELFLGDFAKRVEVKGDTLVLYLEEGKLSIEGRFENVCENKIVKEVWLDNFFKR